jgi:EAL domain-containing protein (putative c-di-GMP-specific phosphodiesterase class I)
MYHAKENGCNNFQFFKMEMNTKAVERQSLESGLCRALERQEFLLYYQPKVDLNTSEITGMEALIRWRQPDWGLVLPSQFVPIAEDCGLIVPIGRWALREACRQAHEWQGAVCRSSVFPSMSPPPNSAMRILLKASRRSYPRSGWILDFSTSSSRKAA